VGYADPFSTMGNNALRHNHAGEVQHTVVALSITDVQPDDRVILPHDRGRTVDGWLGLGRGDVNSARCIHDARLDILLHGWSP